MVPKPFDPKNCLFGVYPTLGSKATIQMGASGSLVGYLQSVLKCKSGQSQLNIRPLPGPWDFGPMTRDALISFQAFWSALGADLTVDGVCGPQTWPWIDWAAKGFPS